MPFDNVRVSSFPYFQPPSWLCFLFRLSPFFKRVTTIIAKRLHLRPGFLTSSADRTGFGGWILIVFPHVCAHRTATFIGRSRGALPLPQSCPKRTLLNGHETCCSFCSARGLGMTSHAGRRNPSFHPGWQLATRSRRGELKHHQISIEA